MADSLAALTQTIQAFSAKRDWQQFHSPKNLSMALSVEVAELMEHFQWLSQEQSQHLPDDSLQQVALELADIQIYLTRLADVLGIDLIAASTEKMALNAQRFPNAMDGSNHG